jgi:hypothetical protein
MCSKEHFCTLNYCSRVFKSVQTKLNLSPKSPDQILNLIGQRQTKRYKQSIEKTFLTLYISFLPLVNFTSILRQAFAPLFLRRKSTNLKCKYKKPRCNYSWEKAASKMLVKLTPPIHLSSKDFFPLSRYRRSSNAFHWLHSLKGN